MSVKTAEKIYINFWTPLTIFGGPFWVQNSPQMTQIRKNVNLAQKNQTNYEISSGTLQKQMVQSFQTDSFENGEREIESLRERERENEREGASKKER